MPTNRVRRNLARRANMLTARAALVVARLPFLAAKDRVYNEAYYREVEPVHGPMYDRLAEAICELIAPTSVVDVGCGPGVLLAALKRRGVDVIGVEGSRHAIAMSPVRERIVRCNIERGVPPVGRHDLCVCMEVAEHLAARHAQRLVADLVGVSDLVVFSAARPGQGGALHVNEQSHSYWVNLFAESGFRSFSSLEAELKHAIADIEQPSWMHENLMVFAARGREARTASF